jgi:hypothetical protein
MLRVYCSCTGVSATMNLRCSVEKKRVVEEPPDQRRFPIVHAAAGDEPQHVFGRVPVQPGTNIALD